jgi:UDP-glucose 4-epimerase
MENLDATGEDDGVILITGGMGFIGLHTARHLLDLGHDVVITKFRTSRMPSFLADDVGKRLSVASLDLSNPDAVETALREHAITSIVHLAVPPRTNLDPATELAGSTAAFLGVMRAAINCGVRRVTAASSLIVYNGLTPKEGPFTEDMRLPVSASHPIEADKKVDEIMASFLTKSGALDIVRARIGVIWGPLYHTMMNPPSRLALLALGRSERYAGLPDPLAAHPDDMMDLLYGPDCGAALAALHVSETLRHDVYNVSGGQMTRYGDLVAAVNRAVPDANLVLRPPSRPSVGGATGYVDMTRLREDTGFAPTRDLDTAVAEYIAWLRANPE